MITVKKGKGKMVVGNRKGASTTKSGRIYKSGVLDIDTTSQRGTMRG